MQTDELRVTRLPKCLNSQSHVYFLIKKCCRGPGGGEREGEVLRSILAKLCCYILCIYEYVTTKPPIMYIMHQ